jgi:hypothetical protein
MEKGGGRTYPDHGASAPTKQNIFQVILPKCCYCYPNEIDRFMQQYHTSNASAKNGGVCLSGLKITGKMEKRANTHAPLSPTYLLPVYFKLIPLL